MNPLLFILHDDATFQAYRWLCGLVGIECVRAEGGLHALTQLERTQVSAVICDPRLSDMKALELHSILRSDPVTSTLPFFMRSAHRSEELNTAEDDILEPQLPTPQALAKVLNKVQPDLALPAPFIHTDPNLYSDQGTFSIPELITWLNENQKTGHWLIALPSGTAYLIMQKGELIYGEMAQERGQGSLVAVLLETGNNEREEVSFYAVEQLAEGYPQNIDVGTKHLLITSSVALDHIKADIIG